MSRESENVVRLPRRPVEPETEALRPFYVSEMEGRETPKPEWVVDGVFLRGTVAVLAGNPGLGKSLLLQQLMNCVAMGADFLGRETVQSKAFGLFCEDPQIQLELREAAICAHYDRSFSDFEADLSWQSRDGKSAVLVEYDRWGVTPKFTSLWHDLWALCAEDGINVVGLDTAAVVYSGPDSRVQVTAFIRELQKKAIEINGCIVITMHPPKNNPNGFGGVQSWVGSARAALNLGLPDDYYAEGGASANVRVLRNLKNNYGVGIASERIEYRDGVFVTAEPEMHRKRGPLTYTERQDLKYRLLTGCKRTLMNGGKIPADEMQPTSMPYRARRSTDPAINRIPMNELYLAQADLLDSGQLVRVNVGGRCLVRPHDGPYYESEEIWQMPNAPGGKA